MQVFRAEAIRKIDKQAVQQGFSTFALMENAGASLANHIKPMLHKNNRIIILSGRGNNGGDGIVVARYLLHAGFDVTLSFPFGGPKTETANQHLTYYEQQGFRTKTWDEVRDVDVMIDAMLGIGTTLPLRENIVGILHWCNTSTALRIAIDIPTGVQADQGEVIEKQAFSADYTFALHGAKPSAFLLPSSMYYGKVAIVSIGLKQKSNTHIIREEAVQKSLPTREKSSHKGSFGTSLLLAGSDEMPGSAMLAATGAIRSGTGKLMIGTSKLAATVIAPVVPEATYILNGLEQVSNGDIPDKIKAIGIGPGIADEPLVRTALDHLMKEKIPIVIDAGALLPRNNWHAKGSLILTPHPGEMSRLTGETVENIQANRIEIARGFAEKHQLFLVLKGNRTVIACPDGEVLINSTGNTGLAKGGSGDVLTGMMVSMLATHKKVKDAVVNAVYIHGLCANKWAETYNEASMVASDVHHLLPIVLKELEMPN